MSDDISVVKTLKLENLTVLSMAILEEEALNFYINDMYEVSLIAHPQQLSHIPGGFNTEGRLTKFKFRKSNTWDGLNRLVYIAYCGVEISIIPSKDKEYLEKSVVKFVGHPRVKSNNED